MKTQLGRIVLVVIIATVLLLPALQFVTATTSDSVKNGVELIPLLELQTEQHPIYQELDANTPSSPGDPAPSPFTVTLLLDDFLAPPRWSETLYPFNRFNGIRSALGDAALTWSLGKMTVTATSASWGSGMWTSFGYPHDEKRAINFSSILPSPIISTYQGTITGLAFRIADATLGRSLKVELKNEQPDAQGNINYAPIWSASAILTTGAQTVSWYVPPLTNVTNLNWFLEAPDAGDYIVIDDIALTAAIPTVDLATTGFVWSYAMLLNNWNPLSGLTRDTAQKASDEFDNISASGAQAAAAAVAWDLGVIPYTAAVDIVSKTTVGLLALPRACHGLWPHFVQNGQIVSGTEWSSIDTAIAAIALLEARQALALDTSAVEAFLKSIDWSALVLTNGSLSHGCWADGSPIEPTGQGGWRDFGTESWLVNYAYAIADGEVAVFDALPPTYNGSGFIDELAWLFVPAPVMDRFGIRWADYRAWAATCQVDYYKNELTRTVCTTIRTPSTVRRTYSVSVPPKILWVKCTRLLAWVGSSLPIKVLICSVTPSLCRITRHWRQYSPLPRRYRRGTGWRRTNTSPHSTTRKA